MDVLFTIPAGLIAFCVLLITLAVAELGFRIGRRSSDLGAQTDSAVAVVQNSVLGLMAFLLGLAFSFTAGRFQTRHDLEQKEANCLGTAYLRASLPDSPLARQIRSLLPQYLEARLATLAAGQIDQEAFQQAQARTLDLQNQIWKLDREMFQANPRDLRVSLLTQSLNDAFDAGGDVAEARRYRVPEIMFYLLFLAVFISGGFVGYGFGRTSRRVLPAWLLFASLTAVTIFVILDLDRPERGLIRNRHIPLMSLLQGMEP